MTKEEAKAAALRWIDEATVNGRDTGSGELADYRDRMDYLIDGVLGGLAAVFPLSGLFTVTHYPVQNLLGSSGGIRRVLPPEQLHIQAAGARSFYMEISGAAKLTLPDGSETELPDTGGFVPVRKHLSGGNGVTVCGDYPFLVRNTALYDAEFCGDDHIPAFAPYILYQMPVDFRRLRRVVRSCGSERTEYSDYRCEGERGILLPYECSGEYRLYYDRSPAAVSHDANGDTVLDCAPQAQPLIPLKLAADVTMGTLDRAQTAYYLDVRYAAMLQTIQTETAGDRVQIEPVFGCG